jgi:hypothetical protein
MSEILLAVLADVLGAAVIALITTALRKTWSSGRA